MNAVNATVDQMTSFWRQSTQMVSLMTEAHVVITMRTMGMVGLWPMPKGETHRMLSEKPPVFLESYMAAGHALMSGKTPDAVIQAFTNPLEKKAKSNRRRLSRTRGPVALLP